LERLKRCVANNLVTEVEEARGSTADATCNSKSKLVDRNWKWFVPVGCLTVTLLFLAFIGSILVIVFSAIKSTDVYKEALARARADPAVIEALGSPIKDGFLVSGKTNVNGASGESNRSQGKRDNLRVGRQVTRALELFGARRGSRTNT
jgi:Cytochrome oxidase complex assembly protein 1